MLALYRWFTRRNVAGLTLPVEAVVLRCIGLAYLTAFVVGTFVTKPHVAPHGRGLGIVLALVAFVSGAVATQPRVPDLSKRRVLAAFALVTAATAALAALQPHGLWEAAPGFVGIMAGMRLDRVTGALTLLLSLAVIGASAALAGDGFPTGALVSALPWYLVMRLIREIRAQHEALEASQVAQAQAATAAERGRLAREMHDVLAHSLSALALQLESTRLLAREHRAHEDVARAIDNAHHLAASGLQDARRAIAAARGEELPGPERIGLLAEAFQEQSGLPVEVRIDGEPHELGPDARLAMYRTAQEALTNVRRHAAAERVAIRLDYRPRSTVLVVEDRAKPGTPPPLQPMLSGAGYGLTGMRERAELLGGELRAEPTAQGFRVELRLPA